MKIPIEENTMYILSFSDLFFWLKFKAIGFLVGFIKDDSVLINPLYSGFIPNYGSAPIALVIKKDFLEYKKIFDKLQPTLMLHDNLVSDLNKSLMTIIESKNTLTDSCIERELGFLFSRYDKDTIGNPIAIAGIASVERSYRNFIGFGDQRITTGYWDDRYFNTKINPIPSKPKWLSIDKIGSMSDFDFCKRQIENLMVELTSLLITSQRGIDNTEPTVREFLRRFPRYKDTCYFFTARFTKTHRDFYVCLLKRLEYLHSAIDYFKHLPNNKEG